MLSNWKTTPYNKDGWKKLGNTASLQGCLTCATQRGSALVLHKKEHTWLHLPVSTDETTGSCRLSLNLWELSSTQCSGVACLPWLADF